MAINMVMQKDLERRRGGKRLCDLMWYVNNCCVHGHGIGVRVKLRSRTRKQILNKLYIFSV